MKRRILEMGLVVIMFFGAFAFATIRNGYGTEQPIRAQHALGVQRILVLAVSFPKIPPEKGLSQIRKDILEDTAEYYAQVSYGKTTLIGDVKGWYKLPLSLDDYKVPPENSKLFQQRDRVQRLVEDALNETEKDVVFKQYDHIIIVPGVNSKPGGGYGAPCLAANPGILSGGQRGRARMVTITTRGGQQFNGGIIVTPQNAHYGHAVHDLAHAMGGVVGGNRVIPCLYDIKLQGKVGPLTIESIPKFSIFMGPWDVMSRHVITGKLPPPSMSSWTRLRMGWIEDDQVVEVLPRESRAVTIQPLGGGKGTLIVRIPGPGDKYYLLENRQKLPGDLMIPTNGLLVLHVDDSRESWEGIVRVVNANPKVPDFKDATFGVGQGQTPSVNLPQDLAIEVLWQHNMDLTILVTNKSIAPEVQSVAKRIREIDHRLTTLHESRGSVQAREDLTNIKELLLQMKVGDARAKMENIKWP
jgi:M6 family metalloprotease-like protein